MKEEKEEEEEREGRKQREKERGKGHTHQRNQVFISEVVRHVCIVLDCLSNNKPKYHNISIKDHI